MKVSIVSVSRRAGIPSESMAARKSSFVTSGLRPSNSTSSGSTTGRSSSATGSTRPSEVCSIGIGDPQYR